MVGDSKVEGGGHQGEGWGTAGWKVSRVEGEGTAG